MNFLEANVTVAELARLFSRCPETIRYWTAKKGLRRNPDGRYNLKLSILWLEKYFRESKRPALKVDAMEQQDLAVFLGKNRQWIANRTKRHCLPQNTDGSYNLLKVTRWLCSYYETAARKKYKQQLDTMRRKVGRNTAQLYRFLSGKNTK